MAFENLTLFQIDLEHLQFGPRSMNDESSVDDAETAEAGSRGRFRPLFVLAFLAIGATALWYRSRTTDAEADIESEDAEADLATAQ